MPIQKWDPMLLPRSWFQLPSLLEEEWDTSSQGLTVYETDDEVVIEANVAGVPEEEVDISVEGGTVTIKAEHVETEEEKKKKKVVYRQARAARYLYTINLPTVVDANKAEAKLENGILILVLPKKEEVKPKKITVKAKK